MSQPTARFDADFNPDDVPRWPHYTIEVRGSGNPIRYRADLGGRPITISDEVDDTDSYAVSEAAITHVAGLIAERHLDSCRITAVDADGHRWPMIIGAAGQRHSLHNTDQLSSDDDPPRHRGRWLIYAIAALVAATVATTGAILINRAHQPPPTAAPTGPYQPAAAELPIPAPAGWTTHATWASTPTNGETVVAAGKVWTRIGDDLVALNATTGQPLGRWASRGQQGPLHATVNNTDLIITHTGTTITWRDATNPTKTATITTDTAVTLTASPAGLWWTANHDAWIYTPTGPARRTIPAGATITTATGDTLIATDPLGHIWALTTDAVHTPDPGQLTPPQPGATLRGIIGADTTTIAARWDLPNNAGSVLTFHTLDGKPAAAPLPAPTNSGTNTTNDDNPRYLIVGGICVDLTSRTAVTLPADVRIDRTTGTLAFGTLNGQATTIDLTTGTVIHQQATVTNPATAIAPIDTNLLVTDPSTRKLYLLEVA